MPEAAALYTAFIVGALVLLVALLISWLKGITKKSSEQKEPEQKEEEQREAEKEKAEPQERNKSKAPKKWKPSAGKKWTLPSHPLLAADFKGHTEAVLSLDFDSSGKYLASSSEGA